MMKKNRITMIDDDITADTKEEKLILKNEIKKVEYTISLDQDIDSPDNYRAVFEILDIATVNDSIKFNINTHGGYVHTMVQFYHHMLNCKAHITGIIHTAYSAGAFIALCCDEIIPSRFGGMMLHSMSFGAWGKVEDVQGQTNFNSAQDKDIAKTVFQGFLSKQELQQLNKGTEFWFNSEEINKRLKNWKPLKQRNLN